MQRRRGTSHLVLAVPVSDHATHTVSFGVVFVASLRFFQIANDAGKFGGQPLEGDELRAVEGARVITLLHAECDS